MDFVARFTPVELAYPVIFAPEHALNEIAKLGREDQSGGRR
jgi:hypothetical protein